jgi:hypothetical protein
VRKPAQVASEVRTSPTIGDIERDYPANIEGFGLSAFVTGAFVEELIATPRA